MPVIAALVPAAIGAYQAISGGIKARQARRAAQNLHTPVAAPNKAINDYYQSALQRATAGPYNSLQYQLAKQGANTALGAGIGAIKSDYRGGVGNIGALTTGYNNQLLRAGAQAEQTQRGNMQQLGQAAGMQSGESRYLFQQNQMLPFQKNLQWDYAQLGGANQLIGAGLSNINTGAQTLSLNAMRQNPQYQNMGYGMNPYSY